MIANFALLLIRHSSGTHQARLYTSIGNDTRLSRRIIILDNEAFCHERKGKKRIEKRGEVKQSDEKINQYIFS